MLLVWLFLAFCSASTLMGTIFLKSLLSVHFTFLLPALHSFVGTTSPAFVSSISSAILKSLLLFMPCMPPPPAPRGREQHGCDTATKPRFQRCSQKCSEMVDKRVPDAISVPGGDSGGELRGLGRSWGQCLLLEIQHRMGQGWRGELGDLWRLGSRGSQRERLLH